MDSLAHKGRDERCRSSSRFHPLPSPFSPLAEREGGGVCYELPSTTLASRSTRHAAEDVRHLLLSLSFLPPSFTSSLACCWKTNVTAAARMRLSSGARLTCTAAIVQPPKARRERERAKVWRAREPRLVGCEGQGQGRSKSAAVMLWEWKIIRQRERERERAVGLKGGSAHCIPPLGSPPASPLPFPLAQDCYRSHTRNGATHVSLCSPFRSKDFGESPRAISVSSQTRRECLRLAGAKAPCLRPNRVDAL